MCTLSFFIGVIVLREPNPNSTTQELWHHPLSYPIPWCLGVCGLRVRPLGALGVNCSNPIVWGQEPERFLTMQGGPCLVRGRYLVIRQQGLKAVRAAMWKTTRPRLCMSSTHLLIYIFKHCRMTGLFVDACVSDFSLLCENVNVHVNANVHCELLKSWIPSSLLRYLTNKVWSDC